MNLRNILHGPISYNRMRTRFGIDCVIGVLVGSGLNDHGAHLRTAGVRGERDRCSLRFCKLSHSHQSQEGVVSSAWCLMLFERVQMYLNVFTGTRAKVREFESKTISNFRPRLQKTFVRLHRC